MTTSAVAYYWGDDLYGLERAAEEFGARACGESSFERWHTRGDGSTPDRIAERISTSPLFGGGTLVVVSEPLPLLRAKADREATIALASSVAPGNALVFLESVDGSGRRPAAGEALRQAVAAAGGETRELRAPREGQLASWIEARARERSVRLGRGAAQVLAERVGGFVREGDVDRRRQGQMAVGELEKLALYRPSAEVSADDVRELVPEAIPGSAWALLDAIAERKARHAATLLDRLLGSTPEPVLVTMLHRRLRELLEVVDRLGAGEAPGSLVRSMRLNPYRARRLAEQAHAWTVGELERALEGLLELVPEAIPGSAWALLDAIAERKARHAATLLDRLLGSTPEPVLVTMLHRRLRELLEVVDRLGAGEAPGSLVRSMRLNPYRARRLVEQAHAWTVGELERALEGLLELDVAVKGADGRVSTDAQRRAAFMLWVVERISATR